MVATTTRSTTTTASGDGGVETRYTVPGLSTHDGAEVVEALQTRLFDLIDLTLTLKHIHWNVVGPTFISVHEMLDPQYRGAAAMVDETAERIAAMGGSPCGLASRVAESRSDGEYPYGRAQVPAHLRELEARYAGVIRGHRLAMRYVQDLDTVTEDLLIGQTRELEQFQWFVRAHLESSDGSIGRAHDGSGPAPVDERIELD